MALPFTQAGFFPGCSLATSAKEAAASLVTACRLSGLELVETPDWNCCGTSSAHSLDRELALGLTARNLSLAPAGLPLLVMCPSCHKNLAAARRHLAEDPLRRRQESRRWGRDIDPTLKIVSILEIAHRLARPEGGGEKPLTGLRVAPYYGCTTAMPPALAPLRSRLHGSLERILKRFGAEVVPWREGMRCCGTFLTVTRPDVVGPLVDGILQAARNRRADCLVTVCAMCQMNLEMRTTLTDPPPTLHLSELLALALGAQEGEGWFAKHLVDPRPLLKAKGLLGRKRGEKAPGSESAGRSGST
ncbi:MAG: heterodisulfide reductase subunit B [Deltaproteobacteria bacterium]|nr:heterodisulfide reductase subunit B [Deltaproteobacteria bacterium]